MATIEPSEARGEPAEPAPFTPYIADETALPELTPRAVILGTLLGHGLRRLVALPRAQGRAHRQRVDPGRGHLDHALPRSRSKLGVRDATILENNIVQTAGSAGESIAFGVGVTMPAIMILGFDLEIDAGDAGRGARRPARHPDDDPAAPRAHRRAARAAQVPGRHRLRRGAEGGRLATSRAPRRRRRRRPRRPRRGGSRRSARTPSSPASASASSTRPRWSALQAAGRTCRRRSSARRSTAGSVVGRDLARAARRRLHHRPAHRVDHVRRRRARLPGAHPADQVLRRRASPAPLAPGTHPDRATWARTQIRGAYVLYIGAGAVAAGGIISLVRSLPIIWHGLREGLRDVGAARRGAGAASCAPSATCR